MTIIGETPAEHRKFWKGLMTLLLVTIIGYSLVYLIYPIYNVSFDYFYGIVIGYIVGWANNR